jgi:single-stranded DNA-binding protein
MNMIILSGNIGAEPEFKRYDSGKRRVNFTVALDQYKENEKVETFWLTCYAWDSVCDRLQRCQRNSKLCGRKINITGTLTQSSWMDEETGQKKKRMYVNVQIFDLLSFQTVTESQPEKATCSDAEKIFDAKPAFPTRSRYARRQASTTN